MTDPDTRVSRRLSDKLASEAGTHGIRLSLAAAGPIAMALIYEFIQARAAEWSQDRLVRLGRPNPESVGFAEASLPAIADLAIQIGLPFDRPLSEWTKQQAATLFGIAHDMVQDQAASTLSRPLETDIPF